MLYIFRSCSCYTRLLYQPTRNAQVIVIRFLYIAVSMSSSALHTLILFQY